MPRGTQAPPEPGDFVRSILVSLACKYRLVLERLELVTGRRIDIIHVVGGGARNGLLCQLTADLVGRPVLAGPVEATALGNVLVQALAPGELADLAQLREVRRRSVRRAMSPAEQRPTDLPTFPGGDRTSRQPRPCARLIREVR